jgi:hypothetical protein
VDLSGIGQLVIDVDSGGILEEFAEAGAGIGKTPTWSLDLEVIERLLNSLVLMFVHKCGGKVFVASQLGGATGNSARIASAQF